MLPQLTNSMDSLLVLPILPIVEVGTNDTKTMECTYKGEIKMTPSRGASTAS